MAVLSTAAGGAPVLMPSQVTPASESPVLKRLPPDWPAASDVAPPSPPDSLLDARIAIDHVELQGALPMVDEENQAFVRGIERQTLSLAELQERVQALEAQYALKGYILCRVLLPPQQLRPHGTLKVTVIDGFIEAAPLSGLEPSIASRVQNSLSSVVGRRSVSAVQMEQALMRASQMPGVTLRSAMARGDSPGGVKLLVDGAFQPHVFNVYADNRLSASLGGTEYGLGLTHRPMLAFLDELTLNVTGNAEGWRRVGQSRAPGQFLALQARASTLLGRGANQAWLSATRSEAQPRVAAGVPETVGRYEQVGMGMAVPFLLTRAAQGSWSVEWLHTAQAIDLTELGTLFSQDRYASARVGVQYSEHRASGLSWAVQGVLAMGLRGRTQDATPASHAGADDNFKRVLLSLEAERPFVGASSVRGVTKLQSTFGQPVFVSEQMSLTGGAGVSALQLNGLSVDEGWTVRGEWARDLPTGLDGSRLTGYLFADHVMGKTHNAGVGQSGFMRLAEVGLGARWRQSMRDQSSGQIGVELARRVRGDATQVGRWGLGVYVNFSMN